MALEDDMQQPTIGSGSPENVDMNVGAGGAEDDQKSPPPPDVFVNTVRDHSSAAEVASLPGDSVQEQQQVFARKLWNAANARERAAVLAGDIAGGIAAFVGRLRTRIRCNGYWNESNPGGGELQSGTP